MRPKTQIGGYRVRMQILAGSVVAEPEAFAAAGLEARVLTRNGVTYALGGDTLVITCAGVPVAGDLVLPGPFPRLVQTRLTREPRPALLLFAHLPEGLLALGEAHVSDLGYRRGHLHDVRLRFERPPDTSRITDWLAQVREDPVTALERFVARWWADVPPAAPEPPAPGLAAPGLPAPGPLAAFHRVAAGRAEVHGAAHHILAEPVPGPAGTIIFGQAGDGTFSVATTADGDDPPVWYHGLSDQPLRERERLSAYLLISALTHAAMDGSPGGMAFVDRAQAKRIVAPLRRVPLRPARWPCAHSRFYVGPGTVVLVGEDDADWFEVWVGARDRSQLRRMRKLGLDWASFDE